MLSDRDQRLGDAVALYRELVLELIAFGERALRAGDELERLRDDLYADEQDGAAVALLRKGA